MNCFAGRSKEEWTSGRSKRREEKEGGKEGGRGEGREGGREDLPDFGNLLIESWGRTMSGAMTTNWIFRLRMPHDLKEGGREGGRKREGSDFRAIAKKGEYANERGREGGREEGREGGTYLSKAKDHPPASSSPWPRPSIEPALGKTSTSGLAPVRGREGGEGGREGGV